MKPRYSEQISPSTSPSLYGGSTVNPVFVAQILHETLSSHVLGNYMQSSQEHLKTITYAKFGGQTECILE